MLVLPNRTLDTLYLGPGYEGRRIFVFQAVAPAGTRIPGNDCISHNDN